MEKIVFRTCILMLEKEHNEYKLNLMHGDSFFYINQKDFISLKMKGGDGLALMYQNHARGETNLVDIIKVNLIILCNKRTLTFGDHGKVASVIKEREPVMLERVNDFLIKEFEKEKNIIHIDLFDVINEIKTNLESEINTFLIELMEDKKRMDKTIV